MNKEKNTRREFLKKVAYKAPVVVGLGMLIQPESAEAGIAHNSKVNKKQKQN